MSLVVLALTSLAETQAAAVLGSFVRVDSTRPQFHRSLTLAIQVTRALGPKEKAKLRDFRDPAVSLLRWRHLLSALHFLVMPSAG